MSFTFFIILLLTVCATLNAQKFSNPTNPSGGLIGNHGSIHSGGFTGTSGSISHGGFVGHRQNIGESGQGFVGHASSDKPSHGGLVGHHDARQTLIQNRRVLRAVSYGQNQQYRSPAVNAQSHRSNAQSWQSNYRKPAAANYDYRVEEQEDSPPKPYAFTYESDDVDGKKWSRQESRDANGIITGSYTIQAPYGEIRIVNYRADADGFHAEIQTNEPGMVDSEPANVIVRTISGAGNGAYANQPAYHRS